MSLCPSCHDQHLEREDAFCPNCGAFARRLAIRMNPAGGVLDSDISLSVEDLDDAPFESEGLRLVLALEGGREQEVVEDIDLTDALFGRDEQLPGLRRAVRPKQPVMVSVRARRSGFAPAGAPLLRACFNQEPPQLSLIDASISADAVGVDRRVFISLRNTGGAAWLTGVQARLDGVASRAVTPGGEPDVLAAPGEVFVVKAWISEEEADALRTIKGERAGRLLVQFRGQARPETITMRWRRPEPPRLALDLDPEAAGLTGRRARLAARLRNVGGRPVRVTQIFVRADEADDWRPLAVPPRWRTRIGLDGPGEIAELRPWLTADGTAEGAPLPKGRRTFQIKIGAVTCDDGAVAAFELPIQKVDIDVRPDAVFQGRVAVDFGTTESAVAATLHPNPNRRRPVEGPPFVVELDCVGLPEDDAETGRFLRTALTLSLDGEWHVGADAEEFLAGGEGIRFDRFKWSLVRRADDKREPLASVEAILEQYQSGQPVTTSQVDGELLLVAFLRQLKALIEEHPRIAARIEPANMVFATRPVVFGDGQTEALVKAFVDAGFGDPLEQPFGTERTLILESWPPILLLTTPAEDDVVFKNLAGGRIAASRQAALLPPADQWEKPAAHVVVYDVGGGSADVSILRVTSDADGYFSIAEACSQTSTEFVGLDFEKRIGEALSDWLDKRSGGFDPEHASPVAAAAFAAAVRRFQWNDGLLQPLTQILDTLVLTPDPSLKAVREVLRDSLASDTAGVVTLIQDSYLHDLYLIDDDGRRHDIDFEAYQDLVSDIVSRFLRRYSKPLRDMAEDMRRRAELVPGDPLLRLVISGRGATFPLAKAEIDALWKGYLSSESASFTMVNAAAKSVTSWAGLYLADQLKSDGMEFLPSPLNGDYRIRLPRKPHGKRDESRLMEAVVDPVVRAILPATALPNIALKMDVEVVRGAETAEHPDFVGEAPWPPGVAVGTLWVVIVDPERTSQPVRIVQGVDRDDAIAAATALAAN